MIEELITHVQANNIDAIKLIIESGNININQKDSNGKTALIYATENKNIDIIQLLLGSVKFSNASI